MSSSASSSHAEERLSRVLTQLQLRPHHTDSSKFDAPVSTLDKVGNSSRYFFTVDSDILSSDDRAFYEENGYLLVRNLVSPDDIERYRKRFVQIANKQVDYSPSMTVMRDVALAKQKHLKGEENITKLQDFCEDDELFAYCCHPDVMRIASGIVGPDLRAMHTMLINKPPDLGLGSSRHPPHQDLWYFPFRPPQRIVAVWTAMQHIDKTNGCLFIQPGTHKGPLYFHTYPSDGIVNQAYHGIQHLSSEKHGEAMMPVVMEAGDTLFFHPLLIHGSGRNNSKGYRKAISAHYANSLACEYIDVTGSMQQDIVDDVMSMVRKKGLDPSNVQYADMWRFKSRIAKGQPGKLA